MVTKLALAQSSGMQMALPLFDKSAFQAAEEAVSVPAVSPRRYRMQIMGGISKGDGHTRYLFAAGRIILGKGC